MPIEQALNSWLPLHGHLLLSIPCEGLVVPHGVEVVLPVPTCTAKVAVALQLSAKVRSLLNGTQTAYRILQVWVHLNLFGKLGRLNLDKSSLNRTHVTLLVAKGHTARPNGVLVLVSVNPSVDHITKQIIHYVAKDFSSDHAMQGSNKYSLATVQPL